ncbi:phage integrase SAM-like domain-containing protein [uncultured Bacteroides sp.]|uniref:phage integrase SAM-like domain-containing protein n=1 Tax=uncultured Bacteroides sp. TaxID=162156 RepID=UPI002634EAB4|nr:phage integrase SAM-like domain-containing protein [uncultured Bacteroides sp.]
MATFKATVFKDRQREDKTWNVVIRFTHERKVRYISTTMYVTKKDLTASFKIKNQQIIDRCDELIKVYRKKVEGLFLEVNEMDIDTIVDLFKSSKENKADIDFISFCRKWVVKSSLKGSKNYMSAINSFCTFFGRETVLCSEVTVKTMKEYEEYLSDKPRAQSLYTSAIVRLFNEAREYYNDEDNDIIRIKQTLSKYHPAQQNVAEKRALTVEDIRRIFSLPYSGTRQNGKQCRHDLALDCFRLSFCLMGMNSADLYNATEFDGEYISYYRTKTKDRRNDNAKMVIKVHPIIQPLIEKYRGKERVFNFHERYSSMADLNRSINIGLKEVGKELGIDGLQFYAARHSMATIAINQVRIDKWTVNEMLCHTDPSMRVTDLYIQKDFNPINEANYKLMKYVFGD